MGRLSQAARTARTFREERALSALAALIGTAALLLCGVLAQSAQAETSMVDWGVDGSVTLGLGWSGVGPGSLGLGFDSNHEPAPQLVQGLSGVREVVGGWHVQYALLENGTVWAVGDNSFGELGDTTKADSGTPVRVGTLEHVTALAASGYHAMALTEEGRLWMWGAANAGESGNGNAEGHEQLTTPEENTTLTNVISIGAGGAANFAIVEEEGKKVVKSWGGDTGGILGIGATKPEECTGGGSSKIKCMKSPQNVQGLPSGEGAPYPVQVSAGMASETEAQTAYALMSDGSVYAWGANGHGSLGNGTTEASNTAVKVELKKAFEEEEALYGESGPAKVTAVYGDSGYALALQENGRVIGWGGNTISQLGPGESKYCEGHKTTCENCKGSKSFCDPYPQAVRGLAEGAEGTKVKQLALGGSFNLALTKEGKVYAWAKNSPYGQLGINQEFGPELCGEEGEEGAPQCARTPTLVPELENVSEIGAGFTGGLAIVPAEPVRAPAISTTSGTHSITVKWTFPLQGENANYQIRYGTLGPGAGESPAVKNWSESETSCSVASPCEETLTGLEERPYQIVVRSLAKHGAEQVNQRTAIASPTLSKPVVLGVNTFKGPLTGGTPVTIAGAGFEPGATVTFGGVAATEVRYVTANLLSARSPAKETSGSVHVVVTDGKGSSATGSADQFYYGEFPVVKKVSPVKGPATGGTTVTITGSGFTEVEEVKFGSVPARSFEVVSSGTIKAVSPEQIAGNVHITVTTVGGTSEATPADEYKVVPVVSSVSPNHGSITGGTSVIVTGAGFVPGASGTTFKFGSTKSKSVFCVSTNECTVVAPSHIAGTVDVTAHVETAISETTEADHFTYS